MKKFLSLALALVMTLSLVVVGASATEYKDLTDKASITHSEAVSVMNKLGIITGYSDGSFKPTGNITRGAASKIICMTKLGVATANSLSSSSKVFKDVSATSMYAPYVTYCANLKIVGGYSDGTFKAANSVTGYAFAKMLLTALGVTGTYTGNGWEINVAAAAQEIGLFDGIDETVVMSKALSRDNACQMALNAMNYSATSTVTYGVTVNTNKNGGAVSDGNTTSTQYTFTSSSEAMSFYAVMNAQVKTSTAAEVKGAVLSVSYDNKIETAADSLLKTVFGVTRNTSSADAFGRPNTVYSKSSWTSSLEFSSTAVKTYTTSVTLGSLYTDLGLSAAKGYTRYVDGKDSDVKSTDAQAIAKGISTVLTDSGNGVQTAVYKNSDGTYTITQVNTYVGDVAAVTAKSASKDRSITIAPRGKYTAGAFTTDDFAVDDVVLYTYSNMTGSVGIQSVEKAKTVSGTVTAYNSSTGVTLDTTAYGYSKNVATKANAVKTTATVVLDQYGYAIDVTNATASTTYAYVVAAQDTWNNTVHQARLLFTDGSVKDVTTTAKATEKQLCTYVANSDNTYKLSGGVAQTASVASAKDEKLVENNNYNLSNIKASLVGNGSTVFLVASTNAAGTTVYNAYVGIKNVPTITLKTAAARQVAVATSSANAKLAKVVYIDATENVSISNSTSSSANSIFVYCPEKPTIDDMTSDSKLGKYYTYDAVVNGTITKLNVAAGTDDAAPIEASGVYTNVSYDANKIAATPTADSNYAITDKGTVKAANGVIGFGEKFYGYASDCKVFTIDADKNLTASTIAAIGTDATDTVFFTMNNSNEVNYIYVVPVKSDDNSFDVAAITGEDGATAAGNVTVTKDTGTTTKAVTVSATESVGTNKTVNLVITNVASGATVTVSPATATTLVKDTASYEFTVTATAENGTAQTCTVTVSFTVVNA